MMMIGQSQSNSKQQPQKNETAHNWVLPRQVLILSDKGGTHYK